MTDLLTSAQMRAVEAAAIATGQTTGLELMERAGRAVVDAVFEEWPGFAENPRSAVVLCGPGNNGGDGYVIARLLLGLGWDVRVFHYGDLDKLPPDARANYERVGVPVAPLSDYDRSSGWHCDVLIDALFGIGLKRGLPELGELMGNTSDMVDCFEIEPGHIIGRPAIVAVDIPSGICADSGRVFPHGDEVDRFAIKAHLTVTFHRAKLGHFLGDAPQNVGKLVIKDIGILEALTNQTNGRREANINNAQRIGPPHVSNLGKETSDHKFNHGHAVVLSGGLGHGGAARLAARGALRIGAGLVTVACPAAALIEHASHLTSVMLRPFKDGAGLAEVLSDQRINAICVGPGMGSRAQTCDLVETVLLARRATVVDADGLSAFADDPQRLFDLLHERCVITPHGGEFARLFPEIAAEFSAVPKIGPAYSKVDAARAAAKIAGCIVVFKGADTVIAAPDGRCAVHSAHYDQAAPWLATAGSGDVLAGFITGLLARGNPPMKAAEMAAWLHGACARKFGPGLIAEDLPEQLPAVLRELGV